MADNISIPVQAKVEMASRPLEHAAQKPVLEMKLDILQIWCPVVTLRFYNNRDLVHGWHFLRTTFPQFFQMIPGASQPYDVDSDAEFINFLLTRVIMYQIPNTNQAIWKVQAVKPDYALQQDNRLGGSSQALPVASTQSPPHLNTASADRQTDRPLGLSSLPSMVTTTVTTEQLQSTSILHSSKSIFPNSRGVDYGPCPSSPGIKNTATSSRTASIDFTTPPHSMGAIAINSQLARKDSPFVAAEKAVTSGQKGHFQPPQPSSTIMRVANTQIPLSQPSFRIVKLPSNTTTKAKQIQMRESHRKQYFMIETMITEAELISIRKSYTAGDRAIFKRQAEAKIAIYLHELAPLNLIRARSGRRFVKSAKMTGPNSEAWIAQAAFIGQEFLNKVELDAQICE